MAHKDQRAKELFEFADQQFELERYPSDRNGNLRAWDAADSYLLELALPICQTASKTVIVHDNFGALTLPLLEYQPVCYDDSWMSLEAKNRNITSNGLSPSYTSLTSLETLPKDLAPELIIGRVPKNKTQLKYLLMRLQVWAASDCTLLLGGMDKHLSKGQYDLLERHFGPAKFYPGKKKARVWQANVNKNLPTSKLKQKHYNLTDFGLKLSGLPNVFSANNLDIGTQFFLENLDKLPDSYRVADMACGNGVIGLCYLKQHPQAHMFFADESFQAVESTRQNLASNFPDSVQAIIHANDGLKGIEIKSLDLVLCNPPFHQQHIVSTDIASSLFKDAQKALKINGELWIIANRHLGYHVLLKKLFGNCTVAASNSKFVILCAVNKDR